MLILNIWNLFKYFISKCSAKKQAVHKNAVHKNDRWLEDNILSDYEIKYMDEHLQIEKSRHKDSVHSKLRNHDEK